MFINEQLIKSYIDEIVGRAVESGKKGSALHAVLQEEIAALANEFFLTPQKEFFLSYSDHRNGYIDVVWTLGSTPIVAIEIDLAFRKKSIEKLLQSGASLTIWVYLGKRSFEPMIRVLDPKRQIKVFHYTFGNTPSSKPRKGSTFAKIRQKYPEAWKKWSKEQEDALVEYFRRGLSVEEIADKLGRRPSAIHKRLIKMKLI